MPYFELAATTPTKGVKEKQERRSSIISAVKQNEASKKIESQEKPIFGRSVEIKKTEESKKPINDDISQIIAQSAKPKDVPKMQHLADYDFDLTKNGKMLMQYQTKPN